jgi:hypothetical protein
MTAHHLSSHSTFRFTQKYVKSRILFVNFRVIILLHDFRTLLIHKPMTAIGTKEMYAFVSQLLPVAIELASAFRTSDPEDLWHGPPLP